MSDTASRFLWSAAGPAEEAEGYEEVLKKAVDTTGLGSEVVVGEDNPEFPEA